MTLTGAADLIAAPVAIVVLAVSLTPSDITSITGAVAILIAAIFVGVVNVIAAWAAAKKAVAPIAAKIDVIEGHVNSAATKAEAIIESQKAQMALQREAIDRLEKTAADLARDKAVADARVAPIVFAAPVAAAPESAPVLDQIEKHTEDTATNTKRTEAKVDALDKEP